MKTARVTVPVFPRLDEYAGAWAYEPTRFAELVRVFQRTDLPRHMEFGAPGRQSTMQMIPTGKGGQSIAVASVEGSLMKQQPSMGGTSTIMLRSDIRQAARDPNVSAILLRIDSPGGTVAGNEELVAEVAAARKSKPVWAQVEDLCASAAYWLASQCDQIFANTATAMVGSVGTIWVWYDESKAAEQQGVKTLVFSTGSLKGTGASGSAITDEQQAYIQGLVNDMQVPFSAGVQKGRRLTAGQMDAVKTGQLFMAGAAMKLRLIDGIQPMGTTLTQLAKAK